VKPSVIYGAKSTVDKHGSIPDQLADGRRLAAARGLEVVAEFDDEAASAYRGDRGPGLASAMAECERLSAAHGTATLIVQHSDRLARGDAKQARHLIEVVVWAIKSDVQLLSVQDPEMLAGGDMALLMGAIGGMRNNQDSKRKGDAVKGGLKRRAARGRYSGRRPFGLRYTDAIEDGKSAGILEVDPQEAAVVRRIYAEFVAGQAQAAIAKGLQFDGVRTLTGASWYATTVAEILRNPLYIGEVTFNGERYPGEHPAIVEREVWEKAQRLREARKASGRPRGRRTAGTHLLTDSLLRCTCGAAMSPVTQRNRRSATGVYEVYVCLKRLHYGTDGCAERRLKRDVVDDAVYRYFESLATDLDAIRSLATEGLAREVAGLAARQQEAEGEAASRESRLPEVEADYLRGAISPEDWQRFRPRLQEERDGARAQAQQCERQRGLLEDRIASFDAETAVVEGLARARRQVAGEIRQANGEGLDQLRASVCRLFAGFELASPRARFGSGVLGGQPGVGYLWVGKERDERHPFRLDSGYYLLPYFRPEAMDLARDDGVGVPAPDAAGFPAADRSIVADFFQTLFAAW
jgi:DNA invertase Pin-like site-specific DNA recombinase